MSPCLRLVLLERFLTEFRSYRRKLLLNQLIWWRFTLNHWMKISQSLKEFCTPRNPTSGMLLVLSCFHISLMPAHAECNVGSSSHMDGKKLRIESSIEVNSCGECRDDCTVGCHCQMSYTNFLVSGNAGQFEDTQAGNQ